MASPKPRSTKRRPLAPAFVATVSVLAVAVACSEPTPRDGLGDTNPHGGQGGSGDAGSGPSPFAGATQAGGGAGQSGGSGGASSGAGAASGSDSSPPTCPAAVPEAFGTCEGTLVCTYAGFPAACAPKATCTNGHWQVDYANPGFCNPPGSFGGAGGSTSTGGAAGTGGSAGAAGAAGTGGSAGAGANGANGGSGNPNPEGCPSQPRPDDPCTQEALTCAYGGSFGCGVASTCKNGRWKQQWVSNGFCNPPPACPEEEPSDLETAVPPGGGFGGIAHCRYARGACFVYLEYSTYGTARGWHASTAGYTCDSCCPLERPAIGDDCATAGLLCPGASAEVICRDGKWVARAPDPVGSAGAAGASGAGAGGGSAGSGPDTSCPEYAPRMNDPCIGALSCSYESGCTKTDATCANGRWQNAIAPTQAGCDVPPACPSEEPTAAATATCTPSTGYPTFGQCRYPHGSCFRYLECGGAIGSPRWKAPDYRPDDSCCPEKQPATGSACDDDGAVCSWRSVCDPSANPAPLVCLGGTWQEPLP